MVFEVVRSQASDRDLELVLDYLFETYQSLGDPLSKAFDRAVSRLRSIEDDMEQLGVVPYQGTLLPQVMADLRCVTKDRAIFYFRVVEATEQVQVLAVFFGGQDHQNHMLKRLAGDTD